MSSVLGLVYFAAMAPLMLPAVWRSPNRLLRVGRLAATVIAIGLLLWLVYVDWVKLDNICEHCTWVHVLTFGLFIVVTLGTVSAADTD